MANKQLAKEVRNLVESIKNLSNLGYPTGEIAKKLNISEYSVVSILRRNG